MEFNNELITATFAFGAGLFAILASIFNWDFFFENRKAKIFIMLFGRQGSRIFYSIFGLFLFFLTYKIAAS